MLFWTSICNFANLTYALCSCAVISMEIKLVVHLGFGGFWLSFICFSLDSDEVLWLRKGGDLSLISTDQNLLLLRTASGVPQLYMMLRYLPNTVVMPVGRGLWWPMLDHNSWGFV